jgi:hypothetical protein
MKHTPEDRMRKAAEILRGLSFDVTGCCEGVLNEDDPKHDDECPLWKVVELLEEE